MSIAQDVEQLQKEADEKLKEATRLAVLQQKFPNIQKRVGRWNKVTYFTKDINEKVTHYDSRHNCGCCSDSPLEIWPYAVTDAGKVYSDPPCFTVGEQVPWFDDDSSSGDRAYPGWDNKMRSAGIPEAVIEKVSHHFISEEKFEGDESGE